jgi:hypothetical protein
MNCAIASPARTGPILPLGIFSARFEPTPDCNRHFCDGGHIARNRGSARCHHHMTPALPAKQGTLVMIALVTFAFLAPALALPGLVALVMNGATQTR